MEGLLRGLGFRSPFGVGVLQRANRTLDVWKLPPEPSNDVAVLSVLCPGKGLVGWVLFRSRYVVEVGWRKTSREGPSTQV